MANNLTDVVKKLTASLDDAVKKQVPFAAMLALNETATKAKAEEVRVMQGAFSNPTPFVLNSLRVDRATKQDLKAAVGFKNVYGDFGGAVEKILLPNINGGPRKPKGAEKTLRRNGILRADEFIVPSRTMKLNSYGNISAGIMNKILSNIGAQSDSTANTPADRRTFKYVVGQVGGTRGIWTIQKRGWKPVLIFVKSPTYKKRFDFHAVSNKVIDKEFEPSLSRALERAISTAFK